jgi:hypothetical protein
LTPLLTFDIDRRYTARIERVTHGMFVIGPGSLFPALYRLSEKGWIKGQWGELETGRRARQIRFRAATASTGVSRPAVNWK